MHSENPGKILDKDVALAHVDGDRQLLSELAAMFVQDYPRLIDEAADAIHRRDHSTLERAAHTLKGRLAFFGIRELREQMSDLETMGRENTLAGARWALDAIETGMRLILPEFESLIRELDS
jgi:HPt (histidine-containing phosphotransfer) domain-containing protein